ncbi:RNA-binding signal recognition particle subunit SEC65 [Ascoidea rubescens DSM 1968]|uniref:SRP19-domain-containing protein n=1 Tax=Ascoidea rubescens DSM 1968 TaxID=1344418 RepID=A0A1D2VC25_9ASCO|nr:SRP19-domain-containing protein [Ascoidea rubescens DSM 1968]ODV59110.1 SRP19-domain-containing protein [Ascoidea rubescens DSM 1968]
MPTLEEIDDSDGIDDFDMDIAEFDPSLSTPIAPKIKKTIKRDQNYYDLPLFPDIPQRREVPQPRDVPQVPLVPAMQGKDPSVLADNYRQQLSDKDIESLKKFQLIYPCYFDINRSHSQGRRMPKEFCVENPLAKTIGDYLKQIGFACVIEPEKTHPQDFGNPGRVRVLIRDAKTLEYEDPKFKNKRWLMKSIGKYLKTHPTTLSKVKEFPTNPDLMTNDYQVEKVPKVKGWKMNDIVPLHSSFTMKHPMAKSIYEKEAPIPQLPTQKKKFVKIRP